MEPDKIIGVYLVAYGSKLGVSARNEKHLYICCSDALQVWCPIKIAFDDSCFILGTQVSAALKIMFSWVSYKLYKQMAVIYYLKWS